MNYFWTSKKKRNHTCSMRWFSVSQNCRVVLNLCERDQWHTRGCNTRHTRIHTESVWSVSHFPRVDPEPFFFSHRNWLETTTAGDRSWTICPSSYLRLQFLSHLLCVPFCFCPLLLRCFSVLCLFYSVVCRLVFVVSLAFFPGLCCGGSTQVFFYGTNSNQ